MKAVVRVKYAEKIDDYLDFKDDFPKPKLEKADHVLIKVFAASTNPFDVKAGKGWFSIVKNPKEPVVVCEDCAGVVIEVGDKVSCFKVGDRVVGDLDFVNEGAMGEFVSIGEKYLSKIPDNIKIKDIVGLPMAGLTSLQSLRKLGVKKGSKVVIRGASGGIGHLGVQLAKELGASEIVAISSRVDYCKSLGATQVVNYREEKWEEVLKGKDFDAFYDCVGGYDCWKSASEVLNSSGQYLTVNGDKPGPVNASRIFSTVTSNVNRKFWGMVSSAPYYHQFLRSINKTDLDYLTKLVGDGKLKVVVDREFEFSLKGALDMYNYQISGKAGGKLVMNIRDEDEQQHDDNNK